MTPRNMFRAVGRVTRVTRIAKKADISVATCHTAKPRLYRLQVDRDA